MTEHSIPPVYDGNSRILILGSFPSVKSREVRFFYGHPQNRFWKVLAKIFNETVPEDICSKKEFLLRYGIALWDVIKECEITGSSDSSVKNVVPNDISGIIANSRIGCIFVNGRCAQKYYERYIRPECDIPYIPLPSTSPANASYSFEKLCKAWWIILTELQ